MGLIKAVIDLVDNTVKKEPVRVAYVITGAVLFVLTKYGIAVPKASLYDAVVTVLPVIFGGELARNHVSPAKPPSA